MRAENIELMEDLLKDTIESVGQFNDGSKEKGAVIGQVCSLAERINATEQIQMEYWNNNDRREVEKEKNQAAIEIEKEKLKTDKWRKKVETVKAVTPWALALFWGGIEIWRLTIAGQIEENGHITSSIGRSVFSPSRIFGKS